MGYQFIGRKILDFELELKKPSIAVNYRDTFSIPFAIKNHPMLEQEKFVFTVKRIIEGSDRKGRAPLTGDIVFQKNITINDVTPLTDDEGEVLGCEFFVTASKAETELIPKGRCAYDLALVNESAGVEWELVGPGLFFVGEALRYE